MIISDSMIQIIKRALDEDMPFGDITSDAIFKDEQSTAKLIAKEKGIISGIDVAKAVFLEVDSTACVDIKIKDSEPVSEGDIIAVIKGRTSSLLKAERTALNILQRMSGIATKTGSFTEKVKGRDVKIVDTRKTTPGLRMLEKYSVIQGGGNNHRFSLSDAVMIKDNHIKAAGSIKEAISKVRKSAPFTAKIEVETSNINEVKEALKENADIIMLDNMSLKDIVEAVNYIDKRAIIEASGNVSIETISGIAETGVDIISIGALTHSFSSLDISMKIE
jgi:nicotinate-nucleotide pyrophosphorylase (carboxylating)